MTPPKSTIVFSTDGVHRRPFDFFRTGHSLDASLGIYLDFSSVGHMILVEELKDISRDRPSSLLYSPDIKGRLGRSV